MTTIRTARRSFLPGRHTLAALIAGAGIALTPLPAAANASAPAAPVAAGPAAAPLALKGSVAAPTHAAQVAVDTAIAQRGKAYKWAGAGPNVYDCSGLTQFAYNAAGVKLPHSSKMQATMGRPVSKAALQPGDLVFFYNPIGHVGMYIGNGQLVHAPTAGDVVKVSNVDTMKGFTTARRLV